MTTTPVTTPFERQFVRLARLLAASLVALGLLVLIGWELDLEFLKRVHSSFAIMRPTTALLFVLLGLGLWFDVPDKPARITRFCAATIIAIATLTVVQFGLHFITDQPPTTPMALSTAIVFSFLGGALWCLDHGTRVRPSQLFVMPVFAIAMLSFSGYVYGASSLYSFGPYVSFGVHSTLGLLAASVALLAIRPRDGIMIVVTSETAAGELLRRMLPAFVLVPLVLGWLRLRGQDLGFYDTKLGVAILVSSSACFLSLVGWIGATTVLRSNVKHLEAEARYRDLYENAPDMHVAVGPDGIVTDCNRTLALASGYEKHEIVGKPFYALYNEEDYAALEEVFAASRQKVGEVKLAHVSSDRAAVLRDVLTTLRERSRVTDSERTLRRKNGELLAVSVNVAPTVNTKGELVGFKAVWRDISERKRAQRDQQLLFEIAELRRSAADVDDVLYNTSERLARHFGVSRCMFADVDTERNCLIVRRDFHDGVQSIVGDQPFSGFHPDNLAALRAGRVVIVDDATTHSSTAARYDGRHRGLGVRSFIGVPLLRDNRWAGVLIVSDGAARPWAQREIALAETVAERTWLWVEHLRMLEALREREAAEVRRQGEEKFRLLIENIRDYAIYVLDQKGTITSVNPGAERLSGYRAEELVGRHFDVLYTPEDLARNHPATELERVFHDGRYEEEGWRLRKDGTRFWSNVAITPFLDSNGAPLGFVKIARDFTERRKTETALQERQAKLTASLKEREILLQEVHHRVKNNLQVIGSLMNLQMRQLDDAGAHAALTECKTRVEAIALIHEQLYQSKNYANVSFAEYARGLAASIFRATGASQRNVQLDIDIAGVSLGVDKAIPCALILNELITNSLKHGFPEGRRGTITVALTPLIDQRVALTVRDDGVGLPAGFAVGQELASLGMQLVEMLTDQLEGQIAVEHQHGAAFRIEFPVGDEAVHAAA